MNPRAEQRRNRLALSLSIVAVAFAGLWLLLVGFNSFAIEGSYSADSVFYIDAARNIAAGDGIANRVARLDWAIASNRYLPEPMTTWPPLYPLAIAGCELIGVPAEQAALLIPILGAGAILAFGALLGKSLFGWQAGVLIVGALTQFASLRFAAIHAWSETMGLSFALLALLLAVAAGRGERGRTLAFAAGVAAGCAFATRYALGPFILPLLALTCVQGFKRSLLLRCAALILGFSVVAAPIVLRNTFLTGELGGPEAAAGAGFLHHVGAAAALLRWVFVPDGAVPRILYGIAIIVAIVASFFYLRSHGAKQSAKRFFIRARWFVWAWPALYIFILVLSETRYVIEPINARLMLPATLFLFIALAGTTTCLVPKRLIVAPALGVLLAGHAAWTEWRQAAPVVGTDLPRVYDLSPDVANSAVMSWLNEHLSGNDLIVAIDSFDLALYLGPVDLLFLFSALPAETQPDFEEIRDYLFKRSESFDSVYFVLRDRPFASDSRSGIAFVDDLRAGDTRAYPGLLPVGALEDGRIYELQLR